MSDEPDVTDSGSPSLDDLADVAAKTNRGLLAVEDLLISVRDLLVCALVLMGVYFISTLHAIGKVRV